MPLLQHTAEKWKIHLNTNLIIHFLGNTEIENQPNIIVNSHEIIPPSWKFSAVFSSYQSVYHELFSGLVISNVQETLYNSWKTFTFWLTQVGRSIKNWKVYFTSAYINVGKFLCFFFTCLKILFSITLWSMPFALEWYRFFPQSEITEKKTWTKGQHPCTPKLYYISDYCASPHLKQITWLLCHGSDTVGVHWQVFCMNHCVSVH